MFLSDQQIAKQLGMTLEEWESAAAVLERRGLPRRDALFGDRRCWAAVQQFLVNRASGAQPALNTTAAQGGKYVITKTDGPNTRSEGKKERKRKCATVLDLQQARLDAGLPADLRSRP